MTSKKIATTTLTILSIVIYTLWETGPLNPNKTSINKGVYMTKDNSNYSIVIPSNQRRSINDILVASNVDSLIISYKYGTMIYGISEYGVKKQWFYIDASSTKNTYGGFSNEEFRKNEIITIGEIYLDSIQSSEEIWRKFK